MYQPEYIQINNLLSYKSEKIEIPQNEATLITGSNLDDSGQKGNGSGKSGIAEAISLLITGSLIRKCNVKEVIRDGENELSLEGVWAKGKSSIRICRSFFANSKSSTLDIYLNGSKTKEKITGVPHGNELILGFFGITRNDFFDFFLLTKEKYKPFLESSDAKKKETIGRFFNYNKIDSAVSNVDADIKSIEAKNAVLTNELSKIQGKQERAESEMDSVKNEDSSKLIEQYKTAISGHETSIELLQKGIKEDNEKVSTNSDSLERGGVALEKSNATISELESEISKLSSKVDSFSKEKREKVSSLETEISECNDIVKGVEKDIQEQKGYISEASGLKSEYEGYLKSFIECPKCSHEFTLSCELSESEIKSIVKEADEVISDSQAKIAEFQSTIDEAKEVKKSIQSDIDALDSEYSEKSKSTQQELDKLLASKKSELENKAKIETAIENLRSANRTLLLGTNSKENEIKALRTQIKETSDKIDEIKNSSSENSKLKKLKEEIKGYKASIKETDKQIESNNAEIQTLNELKINLKSFKSHLSNKSINNITSYTNHFLELIRSDLSIDIEGYKILSNGDEREQLNAMVYRRGVLKGNYGRFSAGERSRINLCVDLAIQELVNQSSGDKGMNLLIYDETMDSVDSLGLESIINSLQGVGRTVLLISQNEVNSVNSITIEKQNEVSYVKR